MPRFAANISMMFGEVPFAQRFDAAARAGVPAVEFLFPYELPPQEIARLLQASALASASTSEPEPIVAYDRQGQFEAALKSPYGLVSDFPSGTNQTPFSLTFNAGSESFIATVTAPGAGTTFTVALPLVEPPGATPDEPGDQGVTA